QPLVLILEDLQWVSQSLEPLKQILLVQEQLPTLMIVGNYRNDETPMLRVDLADMTYLNLGRLDKVDIKKLATSILGERGAHSDVIQALQQHSEGNAFFVAETVRAIAEEQGSLEKVTAAELSKVVFTSSMEELMKRRLIKVDVKYAEIQTLAAIIGREVDIQLLTHTHDEAHVGAWLRDAAEHSVLNIQENTWRFAHDKLRETLIVNIPNDILPQIHRTAAETIEAIYPDEAEYNEALLAHWQAAKDLDKAYQYLLPVVEYMMKIGKYTAVQNLLHRMLDQLQDNDKRCIPLWNWLARSTEQQGNVVESQKSAQRAFQLATEVNDSAGLAMSLYNLGVIAFIEGKYESAFELHQQGLAIRKEIQDQKGITESLNHMAIVVADQGDFDSALDLFEQSLVIQQKRGDKRGIATSLNNIGTVSRLQGNITRARALHQQSLAIKQELGDKRGIVSNLNNLANIQEDDDLAKELYQQSLAINQNLGDKRGIFHGFLGLAKIAFKQSDEQAPSWYVQALHTAYSIQAIPQTLSAILGLSGVLLQRGQAKRATQLIGLVQYHPAQNHSTRDEVNELMPLLEATISPDSLQAALERGKELNLDTVVQELLDEFGEDTEIIDKNL
ncbi:MAG: tetratricopeptide repeat protein, partial [Chloroflexota bacterium]